ncbi:hypothetical protein HMPREF9123_1867 [Neisseria bacilliformis ATCC BAA-1200]|uniref:Uncharacterized protein n=1 Tax=Neisseria bacilliformis ATCC BAA-1200 TaxID=888742 RepID=F2BDR1_9NEIS|nr:hypothetical protein HMPREF9123_1867 [Neisseria bacilliformis ATCC BAA-1200]
MFVGHECPTYSTENPQFVFSDGLCAAENACAASGDAPYV